jgi:hypothetical protein
MPDLCDRYGADVLDDVFRYRKSPGTDIPGSFSTQSGLRREAPMLESIACAAHARQGKNATTSFSAGTWGCRV